MPERKKSPAFPRNREPILGVLETAFGDDPHRILEVASGPGEHVCFFAKALPRCTFHPTERTPDLLASIDAWRTALGVENVMPAALLDVDDDSTWPRGLYDGLIAVNFLHMVGLDTVAQLFALGGRALTPGAHLFVYDCFTFEGKHVSESNVAFDLHLKANTPAGAVHPFEAVVEHALDAGFLPDPEVCWLPANNQGVVFTRG